MKPLLLAAILTAAGAFSAAAGSYMTDLPLLTFPGETGGTLSTQSGILLPVPGEAGK
ncbi:hypothetical protein [Pseudaestuariivita atlantica]|uniref:hypothetical protein n=1 Tax=Pseudaestuariivita atlantica TaxID=1317121 RepID=UPI0013F3C3C5|nr:hypothetical protein [Pseudaestuariivita atlantica]